MFDQLLEARIAAWKLVPVEAAKQAVQLSDLWQKVANYPIPVPSLMIYHPEEDGFRFVTDPELIPKEPGWILMKTAGEWGPASKLRELFVAAQKPLGGPAPLQTALVGGLLGSGLGYGGGLLAEKLMPDTFQKERLRRAAAALGGVLGAAPGLYGMSIPFREHHTLPGTNADYGWKIASHSLADLDPGYVQKIAEYTNTYGDGGSFFMSTIPVDAFNNAVWTDVNPNPYGTKSRFGDNRQPLGTPLPVAAAASGLVTGAAALQGGAPAVSPFDIGLAAAKGGAVGLATGMVAGKVLGRLAGLSPGAQSMLRQTGLWGGILSSVMGKVFGGN